VRVALDTNRYVDLCKEVEQTVSLLEEADAIQLPFVVIGKLRAGIVHGRRQADNERTLRQRHLEIEDAGSSSLQK
jgi:predicted nucleic acid-binding protein